MEKGLWPQVQKGGGRILSTQPLPDIPGIKTLGDGATFRSRFVVSQIRQKTDKNGKAYWEISVMDSGGTLDAKIWGGSRWIDRSQGPEANRIDPLENGFALALEGKTIGVVGRVGTYKGQSQYTFEEVYFLNQEENPPHNFVQKAPVPVDELEARFWKLVDGCEGPCGNFLRKVFDREGDLWKRFRVLPAAVSHHHAYVHGLLEHTLTTAESAVAVAVRYRDGGAPVSPDVVTAGALLHDLGKLDAYNLSPAPFTTIAGTIHDHIALGYAKFCELAEAHGLDEGSFLHLGHILLSHHGRKEFGSPVVPGTAEAMIVSAADELDFHLFCYGHAVTAMPEGQYISDWNNATQRRYWKAP